MPATQFKLDVSQPGTGISITPTDPVLQQVVRDGDKIKPNEPETWVTHYLRNGSRIVETIVLNTGNGVETFHIMTKVNYQP